MGKIRNKFISLISGEKNYNVQRTKKDTERKGYEKNRIQKVKDTKRKGYVKNRIQKEKDTERTGYRK